MRHLGDITKINGAEAPVVDCIIGGSPCQDLSIAGKRDGLAGERSGLYMDQIRIIKEMRENDRKNGRADEFIRPRYMVWENVPGAFSSNHGKDFATVLEEAVRVIEPEAPPVPVPEKGWPTAGVVMGDGWSVAWRVLDAQFWGVPQRRRRIALVADFGGQSAPEILFVRKGVSGHTEPSGTEGQGFTPRTETGVDGASYAYCLQGNGIDRADTAGCNGKGWKEDISYTLNTIGRHGVCAGFKGRQGAKAGGIGYALEQAPCLNAEGATPHVVCLNDQGGSIMGVSNGVSATLRAQEHGHQPCILDISHRGDVVRECGETVPSLCARAGTGGNNVPCVTYQQVTGSLMANSHPGGVTGQDAQNDMLVVTAVDCRNGTENPDVNGTLQAKSSGGMSLNLQNTVRINKRVRCLTPLECERLQGYPDGWTDIGTWVDSNGKRRKTSDAARYKALGNSIALPPWKWVLKRLCAQYERDATMASLFDGIGGFPRIWEQLNGKGSCLWASEIEEFPMAVTKLRFSPTVEKG